MSGQGKTIARDDASGADELVQDVFEDGGCGAPENSFSRFLTRQAIRQRVLAMMRLEQVPDRNRSSSVSEPVNRGRYRVGSDARSRNERVSRQTSDPPLLDEAGDRRIVVGVIDIDPPKTRPTGLVADRAASWVRIEYDAAADRDRGRVRANDETIATRDDGWRFESHAGVRRAARQYLERCALALSRTRESDASEDLGRSLMKPDSAPVTERPGIGQ
jgi:hypothetical protein